jgi:hypothetical protein
MVEVVALQSKYLEKHHERYYSVLSSFAVFTDRDALILIPGDVFLDGVSEKIMAAASSANPCDELRKIAVSLSVLCINEYIPADYAGGDGINKAGQGVKISAVKAGLFEVHSGSDHKTVAKCKLIPVLGAPFHMSDECRKFSFAHIVSGSVAVDGAKVDRPKAVRMEGGAIHEVTSPNNILVMKRALHDDIVVTSGYTGKDYYAPAMAGLVRCLELESDKYSRDIKVFCQYYTGCTVSMFYALVSPLSGRSFISDGLLAKWMGAPYYPVAGIGAYIKSFYNQHCATYVNAQAILDHKDKLSHGYKLSPAFTSASIAGMYASVKAIYGEEIGPKRLWADGINFSVHRILKSSSDMKMKLMSLTKLAECNKGADYSRECEVAFVERWDSSVGNDNAPAEFVKDFVMRTVTPHNIAEPVMSQYLRMLVSLNC